MWDGTLSLFQLREWTARRPSEVPLLGREFAWIVMRTPEWDEPATPPPRNIIHLPDRSSDVPPPNHPPLEQRLARARHRSRQFTPWPNELRGRRR